MLPEEVCPSLLVLCAGDGGCGQAGRVASKGGGAAPGVKGTVGGQANSERRGDNFYDQNAWQNPHLNSDPVGLNLLRSASSLALRPGRRERDPHTKRLFVRADWKLKKKTHIYEKIFIYTSGT